MTAIERLIKRSLSCTLEISFPRRNTNEVPTTTPAFVFDIDGTLYDKRNRLPGATRALKHLQEKDIPFVFLTNRWTETDVEGAARIQDTFGISVAPSQYISALSQFGDLVPRYAKELVLIVGLDVERAKVIAEYCGFERFITPDEIYAANPTRYAGFVAPDKKADKTRRIVVKAILVFKEPKKSHQDKVLITDLLLSEKGLVGSNSAKNGNRHFSNKGYQQDEQPEIWYAVDLPFKHTVSDYWDRLTGRIIEQTHTCGKPSLAVFNIAETHLLQSHRRLHGSDAPKIDTIWMIGDDVNADIVGANMFNNSTNYTWKSVLVGTGEYRGGMLNGRSIIYWPSFFSTGVWEAVQLALRQVHGHQWWQKAGGDWTN
ncbi:hypothetical protein VTL71DRAFT_8663 [Oculimacula yallundae]|uniref:Uncharacterized protein n=1 Tax=Oculimacula yallundae TaxID=86028 RepID=A0ABR4D0M9_9HELO